MSENRRQTSEDEAVFTWELYASDFKQAIAANHAEISDLEQFWADAGKSILHYFEKGFGSLMTFSLGMLINDAIDAAG